MVFVLLFNPSLWTTAQSLTIGGLFARLSSSRQDTERVKIYYSISRLYWNRNPDSALLMGDKALALSQQVHYETGVALSYLTKGVAYAAKGEYPEALRCHLQSLRISEKTGLEGLSGDNYNNIGIVYTDMGAYAQALGYYAQALAIARKNGVQGTTASLLVNMAEVFKKTNALDSAILYNTRASQITEASHDSLTQSITLLNIGDIYNKKKEPAKALPWLLRSLEISEKIGDKEGIAWSNNALAEAWRQSGQYYRSIALAKKGLRQAQELGLREEVKEANHILYPDYLQLGDFREALAARNAEIALTDSLYAHEKEQEIKSLQSDYELERKQHQIDLLNKDKEIQQQEIARAHINAWLLIGGTILLGLWAFFLLRSNGQKQRLNKLLNIRNTEIVTQNEQLEDLNAIKNKLLSIIGHDLRSPVSTLKGFVDLLKNSTLSPEQIRYFSMQMSDSLTGTSNLLDNLLFWARSQMEGMQAQAKTFDLQPVIRRNRDLVQKRAEDKQVTLSITGTEGPVPIYADEIMTDMVIRNLVENALKFSRAGDRVTITTDIGTKYTIITVQDTGIGIAPADQARLLSGSVSYTTTGTSKEKGSGLGLSLCKELVERNGGTIRFVSEAGKGSAFSFTLPNG